MNRFSYSILAVCIAGSMASPSAASEPAEQPGVKVGSSYAKTRANLLASGWRTDEEWGISGPHRSRSFNQYPEILCGEGYDAICTGRFLNASGALLVTIDQKKKALPVTHVEAD